MVSTKLFHVTEWQVQWRAPLIQLLWRLNFGIMWVLYQLGLTVFQ